MTGSLVRASAGRQTLSTRQSSAGVVPRGAASLGKGFCMQSWPYCVASNTPVQGLAGCGGRQRRAPVGGAAKGMPLKAVTPASVEPTRAPASTLTGADGAAWADAAQRVAQPMIRALDRFVRMVSSSPMVQAAMAAIASVARCSVRR